MNKLIHLALEARKQAYAPYSHFLVGAALECADGTVYTGCNIENSAYSPSLCAERTAFAKAVSEGKREFVRIAIVGGPAGTESTAFCTPCGVCRQVMAEFCTPDFKIICAETNDQAMVLKTQEFSLKSLLPESFSL